MSCDVCYIGENEEGEACAYPFTYIQLLPQGNVCQEIELFVCQGSTEPCMLMWTSRETLSHRLSAYRAPIISWTIEVVRCCTCTSDLLPVYCSWYIFSMQRKKVWISKRNPLNRVWPTPGKPTQQHWRQLFPQIPCYRVPAQWQEALPPSVLQQQTQ